MKIHILLLPCILLFPSACTVHVKPDEASSLTPSPDVGAMGWWSARFRITWPEDNEPDWSIDTIIAARIISPLLSKYENDIKLWRFHRRAARGPGGHRFSFIFFSTSATAQALYREIEGDDTTARLRRDLIVERLLFDNTEKVAKPEVEATSDKAWSIQVQRNWPHFIMGSSRMWLELVRYQAAMQPENQDLYMKYRKVQEEVSEIWRTEASHAFFHHLNALFGYKPVIIIKRDLMTF